MVPMHAKKRKETLNGVAPGDRPAGSGGRNASLLADKNVGATSNVPPSTYHSEIPGIHYAQAQLF